MSDFFFSLAWFRAVTLRERQESLARLPGKSEAHVPAKEASRLLERWREKEPFKSSIVPFEQRLAAEHLPEAELLHLLSEPLADVQRRLAGRLPWLAAFQEAFSQEVSSEPFPLPPNLQGVAVVGFLEAVRPLIERGRRRVRAHAEELARTHAQLLFAPHSVESLLFQGLPRRLLERINRTLVLEMNVARVQGRLAGNDGTERFQRFVESLRRPEVILPIFEEYPILARLCTQTVEQWVGASTELLSRLAADGPLLRQTLLTREPGPLESIAADAGDQHHDGRTVQTLVFSSGIKLVYKPRSLAVDAHFQELLGWINERQVLPPFRALLLLVREGYGWSEFIDNRPCETEEHVEHFYQRLGAQLALFHNLGGMDMHYENLIAEGEHPVIVDLETLFHPQLSDRMFYGTEEERRFVRAIDYSVSRISLLPIAAWARDDHEGVEVGGMGSPEGQLSPREVPYWEELGKDTMRQSRKRILMKGGRNLPTLRGEPVPLHRYTEALCEGFARASRLMMRERDAFLAADGPVRRFAGDEIRVLLRSTQIYYTLLQESYHPDLLRDGLERDRYFDNLWMGMKRRPFLSGVAPAERAALHHGDIPRYSTRPESRDLWSGPGECIPGFLWREGLEAAEKRVRELDESSLERDLWWIRSSILSSLPDAPLEMVRHPAPPREAHGVARARLVAAACLVGDRIGTLAVRLEELPCWLGLHQNGESRWSFSPLTLDLYGGMPGLALFLAQLGQISGEERFTQLARQVTTMLRRLTDWSRTRMGVIGGFEGWGGVLYTFVQLGALWDDPALRAEAESLVEILPPLIEKDRNLDLIGGVAGCLGGLLAVHHVTRSARALAVAVQAGDRLLATRQSQPQGGAGWMTIVPSQQPLSGLSHGASGMGWALLELASASKEARFREAALEAFAYERTLLSHERRNWLDTRQGAGTRPAERRESTCAWCYGAPGIGLARARALRHLDEPGLREDLRVAVAGTMEHGFGYNDSLCHGDLGNLELLVQARALGEVPEGSGLIVESTLEAVLSRVERRAWRCAVTSGIDTPGLMLGLAGIGWGLLRFAEPARVPNVLLLEPPDVLGGAIR